MFCGAGSVVSTAENMAKWLSLHLNNGKTKTGEPLLSQDLLLESYTPQAESERYGLGWQLTAADTNPVRISHSGVLSTYESRQDIVLGEGYGVAVMLNCFTTTKEQAYEISQGIINIIEGKEASIGLPTPKLIDLAIGLVTLLYLVLGIRGILRSDKWSEKRQTNPTWKFCLRLIPQLAPVLLIGWLFFIVPNLDHNSATIKDVFGLWPAAMILLAVIGLIGLLLTAIRIYDRVKIRKTKLY